MSSLLKVLFSKSHFNERTLILITMMIGTFMAALDGSIVNISLPPMAAQFGSTLTQIEWVVLSYMIGFAVSIPLTNWLRETVGFRRLYMGSLTIFILGSALCGVAKNLEWLVVARVIQALGGGALTPTAMAILSTVYPSQERGRAIGIWGLGVVIGPAIGPTLGGLLTGVFGWSSVFWINIPIGLVGIALANRTLHGAAMESRKSKSFDVVGFTSLSVFLVSILLSVNSSSGEAGHSTSPFLLWSLVIISLVIFIFSSLSKQNPLIDLKIFMNQKFLSCALVTVARSAALYGGVFLLPFLMQSLLKFSEVKSGLLMIPGSALVAVLMPFSGRWADSHGPRGITLVGIIILSSSMMVMSFVPMNAAISMILASMFLRGIGLGLLAAPISAATVNSVPEHQVTLASTVSSLLQQCGGAVGVSIFALIHQTAFQRAQGTGINLHDSEAYALRLSFITTGLAFLISILPALRLPKNTKVHQESTELLIE